MQDETHLTKKNSSWLVIIIAIYIIRSFSWFSAELWYDEVLTLTRFVLNPNDPSLLNVFRDYPIANNHILSTAIYWCWTRIVGLPDESLLRLPSICLGIGTIVLIVRHWRHFLGDKLAVIGGIIFAISPVFTAYAYQIRGYSLTFFLATLAVSGALELSRDGKAKRAQAMLFFSSLLLPLVIPTNAMLALPLATLIVADARSRQLSWRQSLLSSLPCLAGFALGAGYYLTIFDQLKRVLAEPDGWNSCWLVIGNLVLALIAHAIVLPLAFFKHPKAGDCGARRMAPLAWTGLAVLCTVGLMLLLSRSGHAPFPRVFLVLLPLVSVLILLAIKENKHQDIIPFTTLAVVILLNGLLWERLADNYTRLQLKKNQVPDNLLQQYYRGQDELRAIARQNDHDMESWFVVTDAYDIMTFRFYWVTRGLPAGQTAGDNELPEDFWNKINHDNLKLRVVAKSPQKAAEIFQKAGFGSKDQLLDKLVRIPGIGKPIRAVYAIE